MGFSTPSKVRILTKLWALLTKGRELGFQQDVRRGTEEREHWTTVSRVLLAFLPCSRIHCLALHESLNLLELNYILMYNITDKQPDSSLCKFHKPFVSSQMISKACQVLPVNVYLGGFQDPRCKDVSESKGHDRYKRALLNVQHTHTKRYSISIC